jgi:PAS domain S-box-containing protein
MPLIEHPQTAQRGNARRLRKLVRTAPAGIPSLKNKADPATQKTPRSLPQADPNKRDIGRDLPAAKQDSRQSSHHSRETTQNTRQSSHDCQISGQAVADIKTRYQLLVNSVTDYALYMLDREGRVVTWNIGAERAKGYAADQILGRNYSIFFLPEDVAAGVPARELETASREGRYEIEAWRLRKDGTKFWALVTLTAIRERNGELRGFAKVTRDMTASKAAEEASRNHNAELERYRSVLDNVDEYSITTLDAQGRFTNWNASAERITGLAAAEMLGQDYSILATEEDRLAGLPQQELEEAARTGRCVRDSWKLRKDGSRLWASGVLSAILDESGTLTGFIRVGRDTTRQKRAEEASQTLNAQLERYRIIVENVTDYVIFTLDAEGRINSWSPGAQNVLGCSPEESLGREYSLVFTPEEIEAGEPRLEMEEAERNGSCATDSWRVRRDGSLFWASGSLTAVRDEAGKLAGFIRVARDMTRQKQMEDSLTHMAADLEDRVRERTMQLEVKIEELRLKNVEVEASAKFVARELHEKEVLFRELHHRVKNNLQVVQSLLKMEVRTLPPSEARVAIESMVLRVRAMAMVHEKLYQMPGLAGLSVAGYLLEIFEGAITSYSVEPSRIRFHLDAGDIPLDLEHAIPFGLLANELISNSLKHGFPAGRKGLISVSIHRVDGVVRMIIQDNGVGLPMNFNAGTCKSMGLKLVESLAHQLGGALLFTSRKGCHVQGDLTRL